MLIPPPPLLIILIFIYIIVVVVAIIISFIVIITQNPSGCLCLIQLFLYQFFLRLMDKPTILIVPGGFTLPELYSDIITHVVSEGYSVQALHLPSVGYKTNVPGTMQDDAAFVASEISKHANEGKDVVLIAHSYGGLPATESTKGLSKVDRQRQGNTGGLVRLAYISCIILPVGEFDASVIMPDNMLPRAAPFEIRFDVWLTSCNLCVWG